MDVAVTGSPCNPFSVQRARRFCTGDVKSHASFDLTDDVLIKFYVAFEPKFGVSEQVLGFDLPLSTTEKTTPYRRPFQSSSQTNEVTVLGGPW